MKIEPQATDDLKTLCEAIEDQRFAMLTFSEEGGSLTSRPMTPLELDAQGHFWFFVSKKSMQSHAQAGWLPVNLSFSNEGDATYVSVAGRAQLVDDAAKVKALWSPVARPWFPAGETDADLGLLRVDPQRIDIWDGPDSTIVRSIALAASIVAAKPIGLGSHEVVQPT